MESPAILIGLPIALAIIMFGLGLSLTVQDFVRVGRWPKAAVIALACQILLLPLLCFGLVELFDLSPVLAVGMMLLAAAPGGTTANLFSHLAGGDVALNITLTAINSVLSIVTIPIVVNLSVRHFLGTSSELSLPPIEVLQVVAIILIPVTIGMGIRHRFSAFADRMENPVKIGSAVVLAGVIAVALVGSWDLFVDNLAVLGPLVIILATLAITMGYWVPKLLGIGRQQSIASALEIGIHNSTLAITIALTIMNQTDLGIAPAMYGLFMFLPAAVATYLFARSQSAVVLR